MTTEIITINNKFKIPKTNTQIIICNLTEAFQKHSKIIKQYVLNNNITIEKLKGHFLYIPPQTVLNEPIEILNDKNDSKEENTTIIIIGENSKVIINEIILNNKKTTKTYFSNIFLAKNSELKYICLQNLNKDSKNTEIRISYLQKNSHIHWFYGGIGSLESNTKIINYLQGNNAHASADILISADDHQKINIENINYYNQQNGSGTVNARSILYNHAQSKITGSINISKKGKGTNAQLNLKSLLLDQTTKTNLIPKLKIKTNDVKAGHSAVIIPLNEEEIFYLVSRGIPCNEAQQLIIEGFLEDLFKDLEYLNKIKKQFHLAIDQKHRKQKMKCIALRENPNIQCQSDNF